MKKILCSIFLLYASASLLHAQNANPPKLTISQGTRKPNDTTSVKKHTTPKAAPVKHQLVYKIINSEQNTFGYDIIDYDRLMIHQPAVPAMPGNKGFATKEDAIKVAKLVMQKINENIMSPSVTPQELTTLKIKL